MRVQLNAVVSPIGHLRNQHGHLVLPDGTALRSWKFREDALSFAFDRLTTYEGELEADEEWVLGAVQIAGNVEHPEDFYITLSVSDKQALCLPLSPSMVDGRPILPIHIGGMEDYAVTLASNMGDLGDDGSKRLVVRFLGLRRKEVF